MVDIENLLSSTQGGYHGKRMRSEINNSDLLISGLQKILRYLKVYPEIINSAWMQNGLIPNKVLK